MRKISSLLAIWAVMIMAMPTFANTRLQDDLITIGKPGSTANKRIKLGSQEIRSNTATSKLEYTHDGVTYKPIGSGTGAGGSSGGINLIANESFEDPITTGWSNTGGTFTQESYEDGTETDAKFARFVATAAGQYFETPLITVPTNFSGGCQADFKKISVSADDLFKLEILDSSSNVLSAANIKKSSWVKFPTIDTPCPTPGSQFRLRVTSLAAGTIDSDYGYLGSNQNLVNISTYKLLGSLKYNATAGCDWNTTSTTISNDFSATVACSTPTVTGNASAPATKIPAIVLSHVPAGELILVARSRFGSYGTGAGTGRFAFFDGTNVSAIQAGGTNAPNYESGGGNISGRFTYTSAQTNLTIKIRGAISGAGATAFISANGATDLEIDAYHLPLTSEIAVNTDQGSWLIDANIGGANAVISATASSYTEIINSTLDLVSNTSKGSAQVEIACSNGNSSTGATCSSGQESIGISFVPPKAGQFEACFEFSATIGNTTTGNLSSNATFQIIETPNAATTIIQEGSSRAPNYVYKQNLGTGGISVGFPNKVCGTFKFSDTSKKTLRLMYESGALSPDLTIMADRDGSTGQRDIHVTVRPILSAYNRPYLSGDQIIMAGTKSGAEHFIVAFGASNYDNACTTSTCGYFKSSSTNALRVDRVGTGLYRLIMSKAYKMIACTGNSWAAGVTGGSTQYPKLNENSNYAEINTYNSAYAAADQGGVFLCTGFID